MTTEFKPKNSPFLGLYLHIPFCLAKCRYCDFYSAAAPLSVREAYVDALVRDVALQAKKAAGYVVDTVYIGGGTPTVLAPEALARVLLAVRESFCLDPLAEITVECNPATFEKGAFEVLAAAGVNRVSLGLQSAHDNELRALGRPHDFKTFVDTFQAVRAAGIQNVSVDLMFGIPHQTGESLGQTLDAVLALAPTHISAYGLRIEEGTPFYAMKKTLPIADDDAVADMQLAIGKRLALAGYEHYEVSNYARPGYRSRHNMRYWQCASYLGLGPGAHSYFEGARFAVPADTAAYVSALTGGKELPPAEVHRLTSHEMREEHVMLGMRLFEGIDESDFCARFGVSFEAAYGPFGALLAGGFLCRKNGRIAFTEKGMYVSNAILSEWLDFGE